MSHGFTNHCRGEAEKGSDKANPRRVAAGEGPVVDREGQEHALVVEGARAADEVLDEADEEEVNEAAEEQIDEEGPEERRRGGGGGRQKDGGGEWEEEAAVAGDFKRFEERAGEEGLRRGVEVTRDGGVDVDQTVED